MATTVASFVAAATATFTQIQTALDNIAADEANLSKQISDLQAQLAAAGLSAADQAALDTLATNAAALAAKTQSIADSVPDLPAPPPAA